MTEDTVKEFAHVHRDAVRVDGSMEIRTPAGSTSDFSRSPPTS
jgi:hypothetical protein